MKPNIILIMTDDQTVNTINCKGNDQIITPNLNKLCERGKYYSNCHILGGTSGAICMPSRAIMHTSKNMFDLFEAGDSIPNNHPLLGEELRKVGYNTFFTGKWHNGIEAFRRSFNSGDNIFFGGMWDHYNVPMNKYDPAGEYDNYIKTVVNFYNSNETQEMRGNKFNPGIHSTDVVSSSAIKFLSEYEEQVPFFLNVAYLAPHDPRVVPDEFIKMYDGIDVDLPSNFLYDHPFAYGNEHERDEQLAQRPLNKSWVKNELKSYYAMITHLDFEIGKIIKTLEQRNLLDDTYIIFTSDNGLSLSAHGLMGKQNLYDESIKVPLICAGPGIKGKLNSDELVLLQDIFPTIMEILEVDIQFSLDGKSFARNLLENHSTQREYLYLAFTDLIRGIKTKDFKLIKYRPKVGVEINQLFDLNKDCDELINLYEYSEYKDIRSNLELKLLELSEQYEKYDNHFTESYWSKYE